MRARPRHQHHIVIIVKIDIIIDLVNGSVSIDIFIFIKIKIVIVQIIRIIGVARTAAPLTRFSVQRGLCGPLPKIFWIKFRATARTNDRTAFKVIKAHVT